MVSGLIRVFVGQDNHTYTHFPVIALTLDLSIISTSLLIILSVFSKSALLLKLKLSQIRDITPIKATTTIISIRVKAFFVLIWDFFKFLFAINGIFKYNLTRIIFLLRNKTNLIKFTFLYNNKNNMKKLLILTAASILFVSQSYAATWSLTSTWTTTSSWTQTVTTTTKNDLVISGTPKVTEVTANSVTLEWSKVEWADWYIVKYGKKSVASSSDKSAEYEDETDDVIIATGATVSQAISKLDANSTYYFAVVTLDKSGNESEIYSSEATATTSASLNSASGTGSTQSWELDVKEVKVVDNKNLTIEFTKELADNNVSLKITKTSDNSDVPVNKTELDATNKKLLKVKVDSVLDNSTAYTVAITSAKDSEWKANKTAITIFITTDANLVVAPDAWSGATMSWALNSTNAPKTWAEETILMVAALLLWTIVVFYLNRRKAFLRNK